MKIPLHHWLFSVLFAAIIAIFAQISIPFVTGVPITGQTLAIGISAIVLGSRLATLANIIYLTMGIIGLPVFSQFGSGLGVLFGQTGGYLFSFVIATYIMGKYLEKTKINYVHSFIANIIGMFITLFIGSIWLKYYLDLSFKVAFISGSVSFIIPGFIKAFVAAFSGVIIRNKLIAARIKLPK